MSLSPLERIKHPCEASPEIILEEWQGFERRVSSMILQAVPQTVRDEVVASRQMTTFGVITYLLVAYSPGGVPEKAEHLQELRRTPRDSACDGSTDSTDTLAPMEKPGQGNRLFLQIQLYNSKGCTR